MWHSRDSKSFSKPLSLTAASELIAMANMFLAGVVAFRVV
jgi:hypothetical protein